MASARVKQMAQSVSDDFNFSKLKYLRELSGRGIKPGPYQVLVAVLNYTDKNGHNAWPGERRLAADTRMAQSTVRAHLKTLVRDGYLIKVQRGHGTGGKGGRATNYSLNLPPRTQHTDDGPIAESEPAYSQIQGDLPPDLPLATAENSATIRSLTSDQETPDHLPEAPRPSPYQGAGTRISCINGCGAEAVNKGRCHECVARDWLPQCSNQGKPQLAKRSYLDDEPPF